MNKEPRGKARGAFARAKALSPERRQEIAKNAAVARWGLMAIRKGNFKKDFGVDVDCYVLNDEQKTAVISQRGMAAAIGLSEIGSGSGQAFTRFTGSKSMNQYVGAELRDRIQKPIRFQWGTGGAQQPPTQINGYDVTILVDVCRVILTAESQGRLSSRYSRLAQQARVILNASAKAGIKGLVYALAGYDVTKEEVIAAFKLYVRDEAREYEKEFPNELYSEWYRLYQLPKPKINKPWKFKHLTVNHIYTPLARSKGRLLELLKIQKAKGHEREKRLHQFLSEIGVKVLRIHLGQLLGIAQVSNSEDEYEQHIKKIFEQVELPKAGS